MKPEIDSDPPPEEEEESIVVEEGSEEDGTLDLDLQGKDVLADHEKEEIEATVEVEDQKRKFSKEKLSQEKEKTNTTRF